MFSWLWNKIDGIKTYLVAAGSIGYGVWQISTDLQKHDLPTALSDFNNTAGIFFGAGLAAVRHAIEKIIAAALQWLPPSQLAALLKALGIALPPVQLPQQPKQ
jgi:hypothetical protein